MILQVYQPSILNYFEIFWKFPAGLYPYTEYNACYGSLYLRIYAQINNNTKGKINNMYFTERLVKLILKSYPRVNAVT